MTASQRQQQFESAINALLQIDSSARVAKNFGFSNSARVIEGGLFACTNNLESYSLKLVEERIDPAGQFIMLCVLTFPPQDEVYFAIKVESDASALNDGLVKLFHEGKSRNDALATGVTKSKINNNVKFYIANGGCVLFHNHEFRESLLTRNNHSIMDEDSTAEIDGIYFSIWPPALSPHRSLIAREFVGYLGTLIGRQKIHEIRVWNASATVSPEMQRLPPSLSVSELETEITKLGGYYPNGEIGKLHFALNFLHHKHFVILSGLSGTGKTQLALQYSRAVHGIKNKSDPDPFITICPIRPEWTDPSGLTGYFDVLSNRYLVPPFLEAVLTAIAHPDSPIFVILDEMNLARVEYYFSDILSAMETNEPLRLHTSGVPLEGSTGIPIPASLPFPSNLFLMGTINVDETSNSISDKVLDRAMVIDMSSVQLEGFLGFLKQNFPSLEPSIKECSSILLATHSILSRERMGFGYRVVEEAIRYHHFASSTRNSPPFGIAESSPYYPGALANPIEVSVLDDIFVQKILVKLRGGEKQRSVLTSLISAFGSMPQSKTLVQDLLADLNEYGSFQFAR